MRLWCDGLKEEKCSKNRKRKQVELDSESDEEDADFQKKTGNKKRKYKLKDKKVEKIVADLKEKLGSTYTALQCCRIWAELIDGELANASEPCENSMLSRAGCGSTSNSTQKKSEVVEALSSTFNPRQPTGHSNIENCSRCYSPLSELKNLKLVGVLMKEEYATEKRAIMNALKKL